MFRSIIAKYCRTTGLCGLIILRNHVSSPSTSRHEELPQDIVEAELVGRNGSCSKYQPQCPLGLFDLIGVLAWSLKNRHSLPCHFREINTLIGSLWKPFTYCRRWSAIYFWRVENLRESVRDKIFHQTDLKYSWLCSIYVVNNVSISNYIEKSIVF